MDTYEKYILMCEKAEEVQEEWKPDVGDWYSLGVKEDETPAICILKCHWEECPSCQYEVTELKDECIYLPRQDQLQEMLIKHRHPKSSVERFCAYYMYHDFFDWVPRKGPMEGKGDIDGNSMEQLWLAFVMHEKYQKRWDEEKENWIN